MPAFRPLSGSYHYRQPPSPRGAAKVHTGGGGAGGAAAATAAGARRSASAGRGGAKPPSAVAAAGSSTTAQRRTSNSGEAGAGISRASSYTKGPSAAAVGSLLDRSLPAARSAAALEDEVAALRQQLAAARDEQVGAGTRGWGLVAREEARGHVGTVGRHCVLRGGSAGGGAAVFTWTCAAARPSDGAAGCPCNPHGSSIPRATPHADDISMSRCQKLAVSTARSLNPTWARSGHTCQGGGGPQPQQHLTVHTDVSAAPPCPLS